MSEPFLRSNRIAALFLYSFVLTVLFCLIGGVPAQAHDTPFSYADLRLSDAGIEMKLEAPAADFAHYLPKIEPKTLLTAAGATANQAAPRIVAFGLRMFLVNGDAIVLLILLQEFDERSQVGAEPAQNAFFLLRIGHRHFNRPVESQRPVANLF